MASEESLASFGWPLCAVAQLCFRELFHCCIGAVVVVTDPCVGGRVCVRAFTLTI